MHNLTFLTMFDILLVTS